MPAPPGGRRKRFRGWPWSPARQNEPVDASDPERHETPEIVVVAALLAGGSGSRFDGSRIDRLDSIHKLGARLRATAVEPPESVFERALRHAHWAGIGPIVIVTGSWSPTREQIGEHFAGGTIVANDRWADGQITSVRTALDSADALGADRVVIGLADQPFVTPDAWRTVASAPGPIAVATYAGRRGNPVALDRSVWHLLPAEGDEGARALMRIRPDLVREVACSGSPADIDTAEDLRRWQNN
jgi:molybdenum cofactor cytidylyltransferase